MEFFQTKSDKRKILERERCILGEIFSDSENSKDSVSSRVQYSRNKSRAQLNDDQLNSEIIPTDDPT